MKKKKKKLEKKKIKKLNLFFENYSILKDAAILRQVVKDPRLKKQLQALMTIQI